MEIFRNMKKERKRDLISLIFYAILLLIITYFYKKNGKNFFVVLSYLIIYLVMGTEIFIGAIEAFGEKRFADKNFLITLSSFISFFIGFFLEANLIILLFDLGDFFEKLAFEKAKENFINLSDIVPKNVNKLLKDGSIVKISTRNIKKGDILLAREGEKIPVEGKVISGEGLLDTSILNGENRPIEVKEKSQVFSASVLKTGQIRYEAQKNFEDSLTFEILDLIKKSRKTNSESEKIIRNFSKIFTPIVFALAIFLAVVPAVLGANIGKFLQKSISFMIIASPTSLILGTSLPYIYGLILSNKNKILVKNKKTFEKIIDSQYFYTNMTKTLTVGEFEVKDIIYYGNYNKNLILDYLYNLEKLSSSQIGKSIVNKLKRRDNPSYFLASEIVNDLDIWAKTYDNEEIKIGRKEFVNAHDDSFDKAIYMSLNDNLVCKIVLEDFLKDDVKESIDYLKNEFSDIAILSSNDEMEVKNLAKDLEISYAFDLFPEDKLNLILNEEKNGHKIVFVGDDEIDKDAFKVSNVGISLAKKDCSFNFKNLDVIIFDKAFGKTKDLVKISKIIDIKAKKNLAIIMITKILLMILSIIGYGPIWLSIVGDVGILIFTIISSANILKKKI
ncbi:HAD-IC family P-type ATPase [Anaerococcus rubeinfantis]|uniref:HAD-IC family P-type ATPase n=1 Tax=Anaerococcus rubeinfantis TaxID=1720199 RepID=UPI00073E2A46|nr:HAD-IC family P-type ATPase [Anaerococcus rubeinfantis]